MTVYNNMEEAVRVANAAINEIAKLQAGLQQRTLQWEGVKDMLATELAQVEWLKEENHRLTAERINAEVMLANQYQEMNKLEAENAKLQAELDRAANEIHRLGMKCSNQEDQLHEVREIYSGMEGFEPETAAEGYCLRILEMMYREALDAIKEVE